MKSGFSNWKKQFEYVKQHEKPQCHNNAKVGQVMYLQNMSLKDILEEQDKKQEKERKRLVDSNRKILQRIIDTIMLLGNKNWLFVVTVNP